MLKRIPYVFALLLLLQVVSAGEIFDGEVQDNVPFTIDGVEHIARYYPSAEKVSIKAGDARVLVELEGCKDLGDLKYCLDSATDGIDDETGDPSSTMELRVLQSGPELDIDRDVSSENPVLGEEVEVTATITNSGNERGYSINYEDNFPSGVRVSGSNKNPIKNGILWVGSLDPGESVSFTYKLKFEEFLTYKSTAEGSFIFNDDVNKVESDPVTFEVKRPYSITESLSPKSVDIGEEMSYNIMINNTDDSSTLYIDSMEVSIPSGTATSHRSIGLELQDSKIVYSGSISGGGSEELSFRLKSSKAVEGDLIVSMDIRAGGESFTEEFTHKVGFGISDIFPEITFSPDPAKGGGELEVEARIVNNGEDTISDISLNMASDIVEARGWRSLELDTDEKHYAFNKIINAPSAEEETVYFITLSGSYDRGSGKRMEFSATKNVTVLPQEMLVEMTPSITRLGGKKFNITLEVRNIAPYKLSYVSFIDSLPQGFDTTGGERYVDLDEMPVGDKRTAYSYVVSVPDTYTAETFEITHIFSGLDTDEEKITNEKVSEVLVKDEEEAGTGRDVQAGDEIGNLTGTDESGPAGNGSAAEEVEEEQEKGFFQRIWSWITGLFSKEPEEKFE